MAWYDILVAPPTGRNEPSKPLIKVGINARNYYEARQQIEAVYGKNSERSPIIPTKK